jgi:hypothetical protein
VPGSVEPTKGRNRGANGSISKPICDNPPMSSLLAGDLRNIISEESARLLTLSEEDSGISEGTGRWSAKQVVGHLIDSAANNHMRFVRAALEGSYEGPGYEQERWVDIHGYAEMPWSELVAFWNRYNELLARVVDRIPEDRLQSQCRIGGGDLMTLGFVVEDYLRHMRHHLAQINRRA